MTAEIFKPCCVESTRVSGGEEGARYGPSLMPGGHASAWPHIKEIFQVHLINMSTNIIYDLKD